MPDPSPPEISPIEEQLAHLARAVDDLSDMLREQGTEIARLKRQLGQLVEREAERDVATGATIPLSDQKPPHW
ncbi:MAG: SlyX family protein [Pararhodobacter sp.]